MALSRFSQNFKSATSGLVLGALLASGFAAAAQADSSKTPSSNGPALYVTGETRQALGDKLAELMLEWANDGKASSKPVTLVIAMPHDLKNNDPNQIWDLMPPDLRQKVESMGPRFTESFKRRVIYGMLNGVPLSTPVPDATQDNAKYCVLTLPRLSDNAAAHARVFAFDSERKLQQVDGTPRQWWTMAASHEVEHCDDPATPSTMQHGDLALEREADQDGMDNLFRHWAELFPYDAPGGSENFFRGFMQARAMNLFRSSDSVHSTFAGLSVPGKSYSQSQQRPLQETDVQKIKASITAMEQKVVDRYDQLLPSGLPAGERLDQAGKVLRDYGTLYKVIKILLEEGAFEADPLQKHMAQGYLDSAVRYVPGDVAAAQVDKKQPEAPSRPYNVASPSPLNQ